MPAATPTIGRMRDRVAIQSPAPAPDDLGQHDGNETWATVATVWAEVVATGGDEFVAGGQVIATASHRVTVRRRDGLGPGQRLVVTTDGNKVLNVVAVLPVEGRRQFLALLCTEQATGV